jgi:hypothetical protein
VFTSLRTRLESTPGDSLLGRLYKVVLPGASGYLPALLSPTASMLSSAGAVFGPPLLLNLAAKYLVHSDVRTPFCLQRGGTRFCRALRRTSVCEHE